MEPGIEDQQEQQLKPPPALLKRYTIERILGKGGSGVVYLCRDKTDTSSLKAIKILSNSVLGSETALARFYREGKVARSIRSPYVVPCYEIILDDGCFALTMEYVEGQNLSEYMESNPNPRTAVVVKILWEVCQGLAVIHQHGLVHRDLKPPNVLLDLDLRARIADFGVARHNASRSLESAAMKAVPFFSRLGSIFKKNDTPEAAALTLSGSLLGTVDYLAPEYIERDILDERSDLFALGVIAFQLFTGELPYTGATVYDRLSARVRGPAPSVSEKAPQVPKACAELVNACLDKDANKRPKSAVEAAAVLEKVAKNLGMQLGLKI